MCVTPVIEHHNGVCTVLPQPFVDQRASQSAYARMCIVVTNLYLHKMCAIPVPVNLTLDDLIRREASNLRLA